MKHKVDKWLQKAIQAHQIGDYPGAERGYRKVLRFEPSNINGLYLLGTQSNATMTITNQPLPASSTNVWMASAAGDASVDTNWSLNHTPNSGETVWLIGDVSAANLAWDSAASDTVAGWRTAVMRTWRFSSATCPR